MERLSEVEVTETALYDRNIPRNGAINDLRMGTVDRRLCCNTCLKDVMKCVGHTGHMTLARPVYHVGYIDLTLKVLRSVCFFCSALLTTDTDLTAHGKRVEGYSINSVRQHLTHMANSGKLKKGCDRCGCPQPSYSRCGLSIRKEFGAKEQEHFESEEEKAFALAPFDAEQAFNILHHISKEDTERLGFPGRPENMILHNLLVPPPIMRPTIMVSDGSRIRGQDDLTLKLQDILKQNRQLLKEQGELDQLVTRSAPEEDVRAKREEAQKTYDLLQFHVCMYMNHDARSFQQIPMKGSIRTSGQVRSIFFRLKGKKGRVRGNLMGKRCDFTSRTVITPDPYMPIDYIGVPETMTLKQTVAEAVNPYNIRKLRRCVQVGAGKPGGAYSLRQGGENIFLGMFTPEQLRGVELRTGDVVERYLQNEDWILFNRQPSLHKQSIMGHRVKIMSGNTFRLPVCDTSPYNADFDGDEMNMHVCQSAAATVEIAEIMAVPRQIISPQSNKPIIGLVQDPVIGAYLLTQRSTLLDKTQMMDLMAHLEPPERGGGRVGSAAAPPAVLRPGPPRWTGKQAFSMIFPPALHFERAVRNGQNDTLMSWLERRVVIRHGQLLAGVLCKNSIGKGVSGGIVHILYRDYGPNEASRFIVNAQRVVNRWLEGAGFSIGIGDCCITQRTHLHIKHILRKLLDYIRDLNGKSHLCSDKTLEAQISCVLQSIINQTGKAALQHVDPHNRIFCAVTSGSKGTPINISQIMACVGQQSVEGQRINVREGKLPCYTSKDEGNPHKHGFVQHSYFKGLSPQEYYFHAMGGREGLVDTAVKTAATGYISRRLVKVMESIAVNSDLTIRTAGQEIIQFQYGGDNFDATYLEKIRAPYLSDSDKALRQRCLDLRVPTAWGWSPSQQRAWRRAARRTRTRRRGCGRNCAARRRCGCRWRRTCSTCPCAWSGCRRPGSTPKKASAWPTTRRGSTRRAGGARQAQCASPAWAVPALLDVPLRVSAAAAERRAGGGAVRGGVGIFIECRHCPGGDGGRHCLLVHRRAVHPDDAQHFSFGWYCHQEHHAGHPAIQGADRCKQEHEDALPDPVPATALLPQRQAGEHLCRVHPARHAQGHCPFFAADIRERGSVDHVRGGGPAPAPPAPPNLRVARRST